MSDPIGLIGSSGGVAGVGRPNMLPRAQNTTIEGADFKNALMKSLEQVNAAQQDADRAVEDLLMGQRQDVEGVILATEKADMAFKMLQSVRNKVLGAYEEIKSIRV